MRRPAISVIMATYNHAQFVEQAINSVLCQGGVDFEFLISDDGSQDNTREVVASICDPRIRFFPNAINRGACVVTNELIDRSSGEFIALINSDDFWEGSDKLANQLNIMRENPELGACFGRARFVDKYSKEIAASALPFGTVFDQSNRSQGAWLRRFFDFGNCICHPTMLIRKSCYSALGMYSNRLRQLPDFDMWISLLKHYQIYIADNVLVNFRILPGENAASQTPTNSIRTINEHFLIAEHFFDDFSRDIFEDGFNDVFKYRGELSDYHIEIEKALLYLDDNQWLGRVYKMVGIGALNRLLGSDEHRFILERDYNIDDRWFHSVMGELDVLRPKVIAELSQGGYALRSFFHKLLGAMLPR